MPSRKKTLMFMAGFFASVGSFALTCTSLGTQDWVSSRVAFLDDTGSNKSFGYVNIDYGLFEGEFQISVVLNYEKEVFQVLQKTSQSGGINVVHILVILFLVAGLFCSLASSGVTCYNSVSNPYQTFFGPIGVYTWNGINETIASQLYRHPCERQSCHRSALAPSPVRWALVKRSLTADELESLRTVFTILVEYKNLD